MGDTPTHTGVGVPAAVGGRGCFPTQKDVLLWVSEAWGGCWQSWSRLKSPESPETSGILLWQQERSLKD